MKRNGVGRRGRIETARPDCNSISVSMLQCLQCYSVSEAAVFLKQLLPYNIVTLQTLQTLQTFQII
jgi:hypothetical protein